MAKTYRTIAERAGKWWTITVPEVPVHTQAKRLDQVEAMAADALALVFDVDPADVEIELEVVLDADGRAALDLAAEARQAADASAAAASAAAQNAARTLHEQGLPMRDVGLIMGLSHQRVHQLIHA